MLREPKAIVPKPLRVLRQIAAVRQRLRNVSAFNDGREIKNRKWDHARDMGRRARSSNTTFVDLLRAISNFFAAATTTFTKPYLAS